MARTVGDVAMLLDVMAGRDPRDPLSVTRPEQSFEAMAEPELRLNGSPFRLI
ncbi:MAG: hypothetical protein Ct9H300mP14_04390 [Gammaproteobacteria bacterium]|nr:MAG: hypothetical protein Ct9H300mP14_04390 [Gammaproteobacteria bacterium]